VALSVASVPSARANEDVVIVVLPMPFGGGCTAEKHYATRPNGNRRKL
jgi:hypothetical protein